MLYDIEKIKKERALPELMRFKTGRRVKTLSDFTSRKEELKKLLQEHEYGYIPKKPLHLTVETVECDSAFAAGKAEFRKLKFTAEFENGSFSFPVRSVIPKNAKSIPAFVHINFRPDVPDKYMPSEEIADRGFACFSFCYKEATSDDGNMKDGIARYLAPGRRTNTSPGKIAMWAWCAMRVMDYIESLEQIDKDNVAVIGHSRLGKTALLTGAFDERFKYVISNDSGCSGAAITRKKLGENIAIITNAFPYWFCQNYKKFVPCEEKLPFDQHCLTSLIAPRHLIIGSAEEDIWADPESEFISCALANEAYEMYGMRGLVYGDSVPKAKCVLDEGDSCYHVRHGLHYLGREDWQVYMDFIEKTMRKAKESSK